MARWNLLLHHGFSWNFFPNFPEIVFRGRNGEVLSRVSLVTYGNIQILWDSVAWNVTAERYIPWFWKKSKIMSFVGNWVPSSNLRSRVPNNPYTRLGQNFVSSPSLLENVKALAGLKVKRPIMVQECFNHDPDLALKSRLNKHALDDFLKLSEL